MAIERCKRYDRFISELDPSLTPSFEREIINLEKINSLFLIYFSRPIGKTNQLRDTSEVLRKSIGRDEREVMCSSRPIP